MKKAITLLLVVAIVLPFIAMAAGVPPADVYAESMPPDGFVYDRPWLHVGFRSDADGVTTWGFDYLTTGFIRSAITYGDVVFSFSFAYTAPRDTDMEYELRETITTPSGKKVRYVKQLHGADNAWRETNALFTYFIDVGLANLEMGVYKYECTVNGHIMYETTFELFDDDRIMVTAYTETEFYDSSYTNNQLTMEQIAVIPAGTILRLESLEGTLAGERYFYETQYDGDYGYVYGGVIDPNTDIKLFR